MLLYKIIPDEFSAFRKLRRTPVQEYVPAWRKDDMAKAVEEDQVNPVPAPEPPSTPSQAPADEVPAIQGKGPEPVYTSDLNGGDEDLGMVEKGVASVLGEDEMEDEGQE